MAGGQGLEEYREAFAVACDALTRLGGELWRAGSGDLEAVMGEVDRVVALGEAARVAITGEALRRGEPGSGARALTPVAWVRAHAPSTRAGGAGQVVAVAEALALPGLAVVKEAVASGVLPVRSAAVVVAEAERLRPLVAEGAEPAVVAGLVAMAVEHGPRGCRMVRPRLLATYGLDDQLQVEQDRLRRFVALSRPRVDALGLAEYRLTVDVEGRAVLEAALGPLSAPTPVEGVRDLRPAERRRGEALLALVKRAVAAGGGGPTSQKTMLVVTVEHETLVERLEAATRSRPGPAGTRGRPRVRAGETIGGSEAGVLLAPETVRRLACDAAILPAVLGSSGELMDLGRVQRLFSLGQVRRLWLRDRECTYPGCDAPAQWCDAHHLVHWADGGASDLDNAGLLCQRHHTVVHQRRYAGRVVHDHDHGDGGGGGGSGGGGGGAAGGGGSRVEWDLRFGSYDQLLATLRAKGAIPPPGMTEREPA